MEKEITKEMIEFFNSKMKENGLYQYKQEEDPLHHDTTNGIVDSVWVDNKGNVYEYYENTFTHYIYPSPSNCVPGTKLYDIIMGGLYTIKAFDEMKKIIDFLKLKDEEMEDKGLPRPVYYGWVWDEMLIAPLVKNDITNSVLNNFAEYNKSKVDKAIELLDEEIKMIKNHEGLNEIDIDLLEQVKKLIVEIDSEK